MHCGLTLRTLDYCYPISIIFSVTQSCLTVWTENYLDLCKMISHRNISFTDWRHISRVETLCISMIRATKTTEIII